MGFESTQWSLVIRARGDAQDARAALESLCRVYRPPVLAYIRGHGYANDAEDLAQTFFTRFIEHAYHSDADPTRGRFRAFLLTAVKRFLIDAGNEARTIKRGGMARFESLDIDHVEAASIEETPELAFDRAWAVAVIDSALRRLRTEAESAGKCQLFDHLSEFLTERPDEADYAKAAQALNLRRNTLAVAVHRLRHRLRELVREELAQTAAGREELDCELRELRTAFGAVLQ